MNSTHSTYSGTGYLRNPNDHYNNFSTKSNYAESGNSIIKEIKEIYYRILSQDLESNRKKYPHVDTLFGQHSTTREAIRTDFKLDEQILDPLQNELLSFYQLEDNWDGEGTKGIPHVAIQQADQFLKDLFECYPSLRPDEVAASPLGEVVIYWGSGKSYKEVTFDGDGGGFFCFEENDQTFSMEDKENSEDSFLESSWFGEVIKKLNDL